MANRRTSRCWTSRLDYGVPSPPTSRLAKPRDWDEFESICSDVFKRRWNDPNIQRHGRSGQRQDGVDIYGLAQHLEPNGHAAVQCKACEVLSITDVRAEVAKAESFRPALKEYTIATTLVRDANLTREVAELSDARVLEGRFRVRIVFWDDICLDVSEHPELIRKYYSAWLVSSEEPELVVSWKCPDVTSETSLGDGGALHASVAPENLQSFVPPTVSAAEFRAHQAFQRENLSGIRPVSWEEVEAYNRKLRALSDDDGFRARWAKWAQSQRLQKHGTTISIRVEVDRVPARDTRVDFTIPPELEVLEGYYVDDVQPPALPSNPLAPTLLPALARLFRNPVLQGLAPLGREPEYVRRLIRPTPKHSFVEGNRIVICFDKLNHNCSYVFFDASEALRLVALSAGDFELAWEARFENRSSIQRGAIHVKASACG